MPRPSASFIGQPKWRRTQHPKAVLIKCPSSGKPVLVGFELTAETWAANPLATCSVRCPLCGALHQWEKTHAWLEEVEDAHTWRREETRLREAYAGREAVNPRRQWSQWDHVFLEQERERRLIALLWKAGLMPLTNKTVLEVGCGSGAKIRDLIKWGAMPDRVAGVDLLPEAIANAQRLLPAEVTLQCCNAAELPHADHTFDIVAQFTMFSSILESPLRRKAAAEMLRVLKRDGTIIWCDLLMDNPWNKTVKGIDKKELRELFPHCSFDLERADLAGPLVRSVASLSWTGSHLLSHIPWLCVQYIGVIQPRAQGLDGSRF